MRGTLYTGQDAVQPVEHFLWHAGHAVVRFECLVGKLPGWGPRAQPPSSTRYLGASLPVARRASIICVETLCTASYLLVAAAGRLSSSPRHSVRCYVAKSYSKDEFLNAQCKSKAELCRSSILQRMLVVLLINAAVSVFAPNVHQAISMSPSIHSLPGIFHPA